MTSPAPARVHVAGSSHLAETVREQLARRGAVLAETFDHPETLAAAVFCDENDVTNLAAAIALREEAPTTRLVLRSYNTRLRKHLPELLGDCVVLSASRLAAPRFVDLAVGAGGPEAGPARRGAIARSRDRLRASHGAAIWRQLWRRPLFRWSLALLVLLVIAQSLLVSSARGYDAVESLHAGLAGIFTLGFTDTGLIGVELAVEPVWLQVAAVATSLFDILLFSVLIGLVADALVSERFARVFGGSARRMSGHVVIAGLGTVGYRILRELCARGYRCAVIERDENGPFLAAARVLGSHVTIADVRQEEEFAQLALDTAVAFIAVTDDDAANLEAAFTARSYAPTLPVVVRCYDPLLAARLERLSSVTASRSVARLAAPAFVEAALRGSAA